MSVSPSQVPYLRSSRSFVEDIHHMSIEMNKAYIDIANCVNNRTIGIFSSSRPVTTGESWFYDENGKHQGQRQIFTFTTTANIPHGVLTINVNKFSRCYGSWTDGTNWYGLINGSNVAILGQISFYITPTDIVFLVGAGAPALVSGIVVLEWLSNV